MCNEELSAPSMSWLRNNLYASFTSFEALWLWYSGYTNSGIDENTSISRKWLGLLSDSAILQNYASALAADAALMAYSRRSCLLCQPTGTSAIGVIMWIEYDRALCQNLWCGMDMGCIHYVGPELVQIALTWLPTVYPHHNFVSVPPIDSDLMYTSWHLITYARKEQAATIRDVYNTHQRLSRTLQHFSLATIDFSIASLRESLGVLNIDETPVNPGFSHCPDGCTNPHIFTDGSCFLNKDRHFSLAGCAFQAYKQIGDNEPFVTRRCLLPGQDHSSYRAEVYLICGYFQT